MWYILSIVLLIIFIIFLNYIKIDQNKIQSVSLLIIFVS
nr:MAG TPA: Protein of unknown function (DUF1514) [Caudoviricetes sp.]